MTRRDSHRWWHPMTTRQCLFTVALATLFFFAAGTAGAMWLRAVDAEIQLQMCVQQVQALHAPP